MASMIWLGVKEQMPLRHLKTANLSPNKPRYEIESRVVIAKGNIIEGIKAKW